MNKIRAFFTPKKNSFKKLNDGRTVFLRLSPFGSYILPEDNLEETKQKIQAQINKMNSVSKIPAILTVLIMLCMLPIIWAMPRGINIFLISAVLLGLLLLIIWLILENIYTEPIVKNFEKIKLEENKKIAILFLILILFFTTIFFAYIRGAISEILALKIKHEEKNENYAQAIKDTQIAMKLSPEYKAFYLANMVYLKQKIGDVEGLNENYARLLAYYDELLKKECAKNSTSCFYERINRANVEKHLENYCLALKDYENCLTLYDSDLRVQKKEKRTEIIKLIEEMKIKCESES